MGSTKDWGKAVAVLATSLMFGALALKGALNNTLGARQILPPAQATATETAPVTKAVVIDSNASLLESVKLSLPSGWKLSKMSQTPGGEAYRITTDAPQSGQPAAFLTIYDAAKWQTATAQGDFTMSTSDKAAFISSMQKVYASGSLSADSEKTLTSLSGDLMGVKAGSQVAMVYLASRDGSFRGVRFYALNDLEKSAEPVYYINLLGPDGKLVVSLGYQLQNFKEAADIKSPSGFLGSFSALLGKGRGSLSWAASLNSLDDLAKSLAVK
jgi:hypothetical protein